MPGNTARDALLKELEEDGASYFTAGLRTNILDLSLTILTVVASLAATVLASTEADHIARWTVAMVAAVPAGAASLQRIVGIRERSNWYFFHAAQVRALATHLKYAHAPDVEEFARRRAEIEVEMEKGWLQVGHSNASRASRTHRRSTPGDAP